MSDDVKALWREAFLRSGGRGGVDFRLVGPYMACYDTGRKDVDPTAGAGEYADKAVKEYLVRFPESGDSQTALFNARADVAAARQDAAEQVAKAEQARDEAVKGLAQEKTNHQYTKEEKDRYGACVDRERKQHAEELVKFKDAQAIEQKLQQSDAMCEQLRADLADTQKKLDNLNKLLSEIGLRAIPQKDWRKVIRIVRPGEKT